MQYAIIAFLTMSIAVTVTSADPKKNSEATADLKAIQGKWKVVKIIKEGKELPVEALAMLDPQMVVTSATMEGLNKGMVVQRFRISVNPNTNPKQIELQPIDEKGNAMKHNYAGPMGEARYLDARPELGIYEIKLDRLKLCIAFLEQPRAKSFGMKDTRDYTVLELEQIKK